MMPLPIDKFPYLLLPAPATSSLRKLGHLRRCGTSTKPYWHALRPQERCYIFIQARNPYEASFPASSRLELSRRNGGGGVSDSGSPTARNAVLQWQ